MEYFLKSEILFGKKMFLQFWKTLLVILKLKEFLNPKNFYFLVDENQIENEFWQISEIVETTGVTFLTCQRFATKLPLTEKNILSSITNKCEYRQIDI
jgi:hypothetical protein